MTTTDQIIEELVQLTHGISDARTKHQYKVNLQILVEMAKREAAHEILDGCTGQSRMMLQ